MVLYRLLGAKSLGEPLKKEGWSWLGVGIKKPPTGTCCYSGWWLIGDGG